MIIETLGLEKKISCAGGERTLLLSLLQAIQATHGGVSYVDADQHLQVESPQRQTCLQSCLLPNNGPWKLTEPLKPDDGLSSAGGWQDKRLCEQAEQGAPCA